MLVNVTTCVSKETQNVLFSISVIKLLLVAKRKLSIYSHIKGLYKKAPQKRPFYPESRVIQIHHKKALFLYL